MANAVNGKQYCESDVWLNINKINKVKSINPQLVINKLVVPETHAEIQQQIKQGKLTQKGHATFQASTCFID